MAQHKDGNWNLPARADGSPPDWETVQIAVLMDIRDELRALNHLLACPNFTGIPHILRDVRRNTTKPKRKKRSGAK